MGFDSTRQLAWFEWLDQTSPGGPGDLCGRHADAMVLPRGWSLDDRRRAAVVGDTEPIVSDRARGRRNHPSARRRNRRKWGEVPPSLFDDSVPPPATRLSPGLAAAAQLIDARLDDAPPENVASAVIDETPAPVETLVDTPAPVELPTAPEADATWTPRFEVDDLDGLLDAKSPLLSRAFRAAKNT